MVQIELFSRSGLKTPAACNFKLRIKFSINSSVSFQNFKFIRVDPITQHVEDEYVSFCHYTPKTLRFVHFQTSGRITHKLVKTFIQNCMFVLLQCQQSKFKLLGYFDHLIATILNIFAT